MKRTLGALLLARFGSQALSLCHPPLHTRTPFSHARPLSSFPLSGRPSPSSSARARMSSLDSVLSEIESVKALVAKLKADPSASSDDSRAAIAQLQSLKAQAATLAQASLVVDGTKSKESQKQWRAGLEDLLTRRFFYLPSFEIYGGVGGLYDFGPMGSALKQNLLAFWRSHFVLNDSMLEIECAAMTPEIVLKTSGHVDKFTDFMVRDEKTGDCYRADKLIEDHVEKLLSDPANPVSSERRSQLQLIRSQAGAMSKEQLDEQIRALDVKATDTGNALSPSFPFNLMFETSIGPTGKFKGYLRPETAQGIFVNYRRLLEFNNGRMPFACAQIGLAFRNEIAPRAGLLRVREFTLAEIEHFVHPQQKNHPRFVDVCDVVLSLYGQDHQLSNTAPRSVSIGVAVAEGVVNNETLGYYMARTQLFLLAAGIDPNRLRFRQHLQNEMAHYAADCWDAEVEGSYGWIECVGHADRSAYDLKVHTERSKVDLVAQEVFAEPKLIESLVLKPNHGLMGKQLGKQPGYKNLQEHLRALDTAGIDALQVALANGPHSVTVADGHSFVLEPAMFEFKRESKKVGAVKYIPSVIEPSFGVGRILYHILEHAYTVREETAAEAQSLSQSKEAKVLRAVLALPAFLAPIKVGVLPISAQDKFAPVIDQLTRALTQRGLSSRPDASAQSIGRRYARLDEIGVPFAITVDFDSLIDNAVTLRERDSTQQIRVPISEAPRILAELVRASEHEAQRKIQRALDTNIADGAIDSTREWEWAAVYAKFPQVNRPESGE